MKKFILSFILITLTLSLMACNKETDDATISFAWWGTSDRNIATYAAIDLFEQKYPQYKVEGEQSPWSGYQQTLNNRLNRGTEADVFQVNYNWIYSMYGVDYFMDLNDLGLDFSKYPEHEHDPLTVDGKVLGLSISETGYIFYLNKKVYQDAGITVLPRTWDELIAAGETISQETPGNYALGRLDAQQVSMMMWSYLAQTTGKNLINEDNELNFTLDEIIDAFNFISDLRSSGVLIPSNAIDTHIDGPTNPNWTSQKYGGIMQWNTAVSEYENTLPNSDENLVMAGMFQQELNEQLGMYKKVSMAYAVSGRVAESDAKKEAVKTFIEFMTTDPEAVELLGVDRGVSSNTDTQEILRLSTIKDFENSLEWKGHEIVQAYYDHQLTLNQELYIHPYYEHNTFRAIYESPVESFLLGNITARVAAQNIVNRFNSELSRIMEG